MCKWVHWPQWPIKYEEGSWIIEGELERLCENHFSHLNIWKIKKMSHIQAQGLPYVIYGTTTKVIRPLKKSGYSWYTWICWWHNSKVLLLPSIKVSNYNKSPWVWGRTTRNLKSSSQFIKQENLIWIEIKLIWINLKIYWGYEIHSQYSNYNFNTLSFYILPHFYQLIIISFNS